jgi:hypothetical protein
VVPGKYRAKCPGKKEGRGRSKRFAATRNRESVDQTLVQGSEVTLSAQGPRHQMQKGQQQCGDEQGDGGDDDGTVIVDWYGENDPENPANWYVRLYFKLTYPETRSLAKKCWVVGLIILLTCTIFMGSSIWTPGLNETPTRILA